MLIADSGSTKTDWRFVNDENKIIAFRSEGYNPRLTDAVQMKESLLKEVLVQLGGQIPKEIFFYGAGCGTEELKNAVKNILAEIFPGASIEVNSDMLGAARSLCGHEQGIAAILGTGSNSCLFDGKDIVEQQVSLGYILGDEGSGAALGKELLRKYFYDELDIRLKENFRRRFDLSVPEALQHIYKEPQPNRYLASFSKFIFQNIEHPQCAEMVIENFRLFFDRTVMKYPGAKKLPFHVTGSVGFYYSNLLRRVAEEKEIHLGRVTETPIAGLVNYHRGE
jgi:N-acetylglucosamine kinase-like BadF-type ATPase